MSTTLNLADHLLSQGRKLHDHGQKREAARLFGHVARLVDIPSGVAEEAHARLAEIHLDWNEAKNARRHLTAALALQPDCAHYHYLLAVAAEEDENCDPKRAKRHYRRCLELDPEQLEYLCDYAQFAMDQGKPSTALRTWRRAAALAANDPDYLGRIAAGLRQVERPEEAKRLLRAAMFRHPHDHRFRGLWDKHQFELLHAAQQPKSKRRSVGHEKPVILRFPKPKKRSAKVGGKTIRFDGPEDLKGPTILSMSVYRKDHAS